MGLPRRSDLTHDVGPVSMVITTARAKSALCCSASQKLQACTGLLLGASTRRSPSVAVVINLIWPCLLDPDITRLALGKQRKVGTEFLELQARHFFVQVFWEYMNADRIF